MRFILRLIGFLSAAAGFVALIIDGARAIANGTWVPTSAGHVAAQVFPASYPQWEQTLAALHPWLWQVTASILAAPAFAVAMAFGIVLMLIARPPREKIGFSID